MMRTTARRVVPAVMLGAGLAAAMAGPAAAGQADPPGNNGTVKIDGVEFDDHPNNQPHVGCVFQVDLYGFDQGDLQATVLFEAVPPTVPGDDALSVVSGHELLADELDIGEDAAGGGTDLDASGTYDLTEELAGIEPHPQQGWHVRLTVHAEGSQGADTKHKVFWVNGCGGSTSTTTGHVSSTTAPGSSTTTPGETTTTTAHGSTTAPPTSGGPSSSVSSGGSSSTTTATSGGGGLPITGSNTVPLVLAAGALIGLGAAGLVAARRLRFTSDR